MVLLNDSSPMISRRVLYIGSAVPLDTATGLDAIQGPLKERYPSDHESGIEGIDSHLSVTNSYLQLQYVNDPEQVIQFPISSLSLCAAVRCVSTVNAASGESADKFVSLNDPLAGGENANRPAIFTALTRRTTGRRVLECHGFICHSPQDALELVKITSFAGKNYKKNGSVKTPRQVTQHKVVQRKNSNGSVVHEANFTFEGETLNRNSNRNSGISSVPVANGSVNGFERSDKPSMRLIPGEPVTIKAGPEFYEPVSKQGYFYSSDKTEIKKFNIAKLQKSTENKENSDAESTKLEQPYSAARPMHVFGQPPMNGYGPPLMNGYGPPPGARPAPNNTFGPPPPIYVRIQRQAPQPQQHPQPRPFFYGPPPPPHPMMFGRPRFFSPPPPRLRPQPFMVPPGAPPPMMAPPIFVRRPRSRSGSRSISAGSRGTGSSRSKSPKENGETEPKRVIPNGDAHSSSDDTVTLRPVTPPQDYSKPKSKGQRRSRRDDYEIRQHPMMGPYPPPPNMPPPHPYDYYVYPPRHGGYAPFTMYNPHGRSRSLPPDPRLRSSSPKKGKGKKPKKNKKKKKTRRYEQKAYPHARSDISTDSYPAGYQSEIPRQRPATTEPDSGYQFYRPRDFRRDENQFMNERNFGKSIIEETRRSRDSKAYPTAYELNQAMNRSGRDDREMEPDFNLY